MEGFDNKNLKMIDASTLREYQNLISNDRLLEYQNSEPSSLDIVDFSFYTSVASVYSSKIEGEQIDLDSYIKYKRFKVDYHEDYTKKIDDLYKAYVFAQNNPLNQQNIFEAHQILSIDFLSFQKRGVLRNSNMYVITKKGMIEYVACTPDNLKSEYDLFLTDIEFLIRANLTLVQIFYFASLIHLTFVKIHPFQDGNGRIGRLLEKWFLSTKLGEKAWLLNSEKMYYEMHNVYYHNLRKLGLEYESLIWGNSLDFSLMLPKIFDSNFL